MYCGSSLTRPPMVVSLSRNGKILRAPTVARVGLNHQKVTGHIFLASLKAAPGSIRYTLNSVPKNHCIPDAVFGPSLGEVLGPTWFAVRPPVPVHPSPRLHFRAQ